MVFFQLPRGFFHCLYHCLLTLKESGSELLYSSTIFALYCASSVIDQHTILIFDEFLINPNWENDEHKALEEFCLQNEFKYEVLAVSFFSKQVAVRLTGFWLGRNNEPMLSIIVFRIGCPKWLELLFRFSLSKIKFSSPKQFFTCH